MKKALHIEEESEQTECMRKILGDTIECILTMIIILGYLIYFNIISIRKPIVFGFIVVYIFFTRMTIEYLTDAIKCKKKLIAICYSFNLILNIITVVSLSRLMLGI